MKAGSTVGISLAVVLAMGSAASGDFVLHGSEYLNVAGGEDKGVLWDSSTADITASGFITTAYVHDTAVLTVQVPSGDAIGTAELYNAGRLAISSGNVRNLVAYDSSRVDIRGGSVSNELEANDSSSVAISGGMVERLVAWDSSRVDVSGADVSGGSGHGEFIAMGTSIMDIRRGSITALTAAGGSTMNFKGGSVSSDLLAYDSSSTNISGGVIFGDLITQQASTVVISGGTVRSLYTRGTSTVTVSGGSVAVSGGGVPGLYAYDSSIITLDGYDFRATGGLSLEQYDMIDGFPQYKVIGTGVLAGKWFDGTPWSIPVYSHAAGATILAIPEPATFALLALGGLALKRRRAGRGR